jgi:DNA-nicking Smr family endonuclease
MNSAGQMGMSVPGRGVQLDFHGLYVNEAKKIIDADVLPVLPVLKKIVLITGRGAHNPKQEAKLKSALKEYFASVKIRCEEMSENQGAICIFANK